jgi:VWFA-related protein
VDTNVVQLAVTVKDAKGMPVGGLKATDFVLTDQGAVRPIRYFSEQQAASSKTNAKERPSRSLALYWDDVNQAAAGFERSRHAAKNWIERGLAEGDHVGIFTDSGAVTVDFTTDTAKLFGAIANMKRHPNTNTARGFGLCPTLTAYQAYVIMSHLDPVALEVAAMEVKACAPETPMDIARQQAEEAARSGWERVKFESVDGLNSLAAVVHRLAAASESRILVMVSPGFVTMGMEEKLAAIGDDCLRARIVVNALDDEGLLSGRTDSPEALGVPSGPRAAWAQRSLMQRGQIVTSLMADLAAATGGTFIRNNNDLDGALRKLSAAPEVSYLLGFSPDGQPDGKYHKLKVMLELDARLTKPSGYVVNARAGYFSEARKAVPETAQQRIDRAVASPEHLEQIPATMRIQTTAEKDGQSRILITINVDPKQLEFGSLEGKSVQQLTLVTLLEDEAGTLLEGKQSVLDFELSPATRTDLETKGIHAETSFVAKPGKYRLREVVREAVHNKLSVMDARIETR